MGEYHEGCALCVDVFFEFADVVDRLLLEAVVLLSPHFSLF